MPDQGDNDLENAEFVQLPIGLIKPAVIPELEANRTEHSNAHETLPAPPELSSPPLVETAAAAAAALVGAATVVVEAPAKGKGPNYFSLLQEKDSGGIEILVQMANRGELDPKNIDIIDATDRFLKAIAAAPRENLRQSGKIIFHASVLLRMKAEALLITRIEDLDIGGADDFVDFDVDGSPIIFDSNDEAVGRQITLADLQRALVRRSKQKQSRSRRVTLEQLIESLREAENLEKKRIEKKEREPKAVIQMDGYHAMEDMDDILDLAHDEDIEDVIARIEQLLVKKMEDMLRLSLSQLIKMLDGGGDWVDAFLAVLFLSNAGKINLEQEVFYGPLYLVKNTAVPAAEALEATGTDGPGLPVGMAELKALSAEFMSLGTERGGVATGRADSQSLESKISAPEHGATDGALKNERALNEGAAALQLAAPIEQDNTIGIGEAKRKRKPVAAKRPGGTSKREKSGKNKKNENQLELEIMVPAESNSDSEPSESSSLRPDSTEAEVYND